VPARDPPPPVFDWWRQMLCRNEGELPPPVCKTAGDGLARLRGEAEGASLRLAAP
jgi:hypothetical protein